jgi:hypothetical protein
MIAKESPRGNKPNFTAANVAPRLSLHANHNHKIRCRKSMDAFENINVGVKALTFFGCQSFGS